MKISITTLSEDKMTLILSNFQVNSNVLHKAVFRVTHSCYVNMQKAFNSLIIVLERKNNSGDLHITAGKLLAEIGPTPS